MQNGELSKSDPGQVKGVRKFIPEQDTNLQKSSLGGGG